MTKAQEGMKIEYKKGYIKISEKKDDNLRKS